ncbi:MAG: response regulator [bacterium]|nr:response regulator [bacterium]
MGGQVLIVEDERDTVELLQYNLKREGYETMVAFNGREAIELLKDHRPDLVLLDIMLPEINGWEICNKLRSKGETFPVIMMTALSAEDDRLKGLGLGADDYISKPFSVKGLSLKVKRHMEKERELRGLRERSAEADDAMSYLVHELRNSLMTVENYSGLAMKGGDKSRYLPHIISSAKDMANILTDVSLLTRLESGGGLACIGSVDISREAKNVTSMSEEWAREKGVELSILNDTACKIIGDRTAVRQVLLNLVSNAIKYNCNNGEVMISFEEKDDLVTVQVSDTGVGIPEEELLRVFDKGYRAGGSEKSKGSGFGLYLVDLLMKAMGGKISVNSIEGGGSTFTVSFKKA